MQGVTLPSEAEAPLAAPPELLTAILSELRAIRVSLETTQAEGLAASETAKLVGIGERNWWQKQAAEQIPAPVRVSEGRVVWLRSELLAWLKAKAPDRATWERLRDHERRARR